MIIAIYVEIELIDEDNNTKYYSFDNSNGKKYGVLAIELSSGEVVLIKTTNSEGITFAYPRARKAIQDHYKSGKLPKSICYAA